MVVNLLKVFLVTTLTEESMESGLGE